MLPKELIYEGEFGSELVLFAPYVRWLAKRGRLADRTVSTYRGMSAFYAGLNIGKLIERDEPRRWLHPEDRAAWLPVKNEHNFDVGRPSNRMDFGDLREQFRDLDLGRRLSSFLSGKPSLVIHNKYAEEWDRAPMNYIPADELASLLDQCEARGHNVIYIRHGSRSSVDGFSDDHNALLQLNDNDVVSGRGNVLDFHDALQWAKEDANQSDVNAVKCAILSRSYKYLTVQGGGAHLMAMFKGSAMAILHRAGAEEHWAYENGYYTFASSPPPRLLTFRTFADMARAASAMLNADIGSNGLVPDPADADIWNGLAPANLKANGPPTLDVKFYPRSGARPRIKRALHRLMAATAV